MYKSESGDGVNLRSTHNTNATYTSTADTPPSQHTELLW